MITVPRAVSAPFLQHHPGGFRIESVTAADVAAGLGTPCYVYSAGAVRDAYHRLEKLREYSSVDFDADESGQAPSF